VPALTPQNAEQRNPRAGACGHDPPNTADYDISRLNEPQQLTHIKFPSMEPLMRGGSFPNQPFNVRHDISNADNVVSRHQTGRHVRYVCRQRASCRIPPFPALCHRTNNCDRFVAHHPRERWQVPTRRGYKKTTFHRINDRTITQTRYAVARTDSSALRRLHNPTHSILAPNVLGLRTQCSIILQEVNGLVILKQLGPRGAYENVIAVSDKCLDECAHVDVVPQSAHRQYTDGHGSTMSAYGARMLMLVFAFACTFRLSPSSMWSGPPSKTLIFVFSETRSSSVNG